MDKLFRELKVGDYFYILDYVSCVLDTDSSVPCRVNSIKNTSHPYCTQVKKLSSSTLSNLNFKVENMDIRKTNALIFNNVKVKPKLPIL